MIRAALIEALLGAVIGAIGFRLAWGMSDSRRIAGWVAAILALAAALAPAAWPSPGGSSLADAIDQAAFALLRAAGVLAGAWLAARIVRWRERKGLGEPPFKDFP